MKLFKKSERTIKASDMRATFRKCGYTVSEIGAYCKWKDLYNGGRLQVTLTIFKIKIPGIEPPCYMIEDTLGRVASQLQTSKTEVMGWLADHGYKTEKRWYIEDYGMSQETWNEWNSQEELL